MSKDSLLVVIRQMMPYVNTFSPDEIERVRKLDSDEALVRVAKESPRLGERLFILANDPESQRRLGENYQDLAALLQPSTHVGSALWRAPASPDEEEAGFVFLPARDGIMGAYREVDVNKLGKRLVEYGRVAPPSFWRVDSRLKGWVAREQDNLTQILGGHRDLLNTVMRFTDVLPEIETDSALVVQHFKEYFPSEDSRLPPLMNQAIRMAHSSLIPDFMIARAIRTGVSQMAGRFIVGENLATARGRLMALAKQGMGIIFDTLGEAVTTEAEADSYRDSTLQNMEALKHNPNFIKQARANFRSYDPKLTFEERHQMDAHFAIKLSALVPLSQWNPADPGNTAEGVKKRLRPLLDKMLELEKTGIRVGLTIDPEEYETRDLGIQIFKEILSEAPYRAMTSLGIGVQCYHRDSLAVIEDLIAWSKTRKDHGEGDSIFIRAIKGAYWDHENLMAKQHGYPLPVFTEKWQSDVNFERAIDLLLANADYVRTAVGSHNTRSVAYAITRARELGVPLEAELLFGMNDALKHALVREGVPIAVYCPMGRLLPGMAYLARRILENASQDSFLLQLLKEDADLEALLKNPLAGHSWPIVFNDAPDYHRHTNLASPFVNEPLLPLWREDVQAQIRNALGWVRETNVEAGVHPILIGDEEIIATSRPPILSRNPSAPDEILGKIASASEIEVVQAVQIAQAGLESWSKTPVQERAAILLKAAHLMREVRHSLIALQILEAGKTVDQADKEVAEAIDFLEYYAREAVKIFDAHPDLEIAPHGVAAVIPPWNFPLAIPTGMMAAALVMGNTVVLKPSKEAPLLGNMLVQILRKAGVPTSALHLLTGDGQTGQWLRAQEGVKLVAFTGSKEVGLDIYKTDAPRGIKVVAEMGGKNALIVDRDAHPDDVIKTILQGKFRHAGQKCSAIDRVIIVGDKKHYNKIVARLKEALQSIPFGNAEQFGNYFGPVINEAAYDRLTQLIDETKEATRLALEIPQDALENMLLAPWSLNSPTSQLSPGKKERFRVLVGKGHTGTSKLVLDGRTDLRKVRGYFLGPTLFEVTNPKDILFREEFFGPVLTVTPAKNLEEAIALAQDSEYGLTGGAITRSPKSEAQLVAQWQEVGNLYVNRVQTGAVVGRHPFGGDKLSGIGASKAGGQDYLWQFAKVGRKNAAWESPLDEIEATSQEAARAFMADKLYQPRLLGEENRVIYRPRGNGLILVGEDANFPEILALMNAAYFVGNKSVALSLPTSWYGSLSWDCPGIASEPTRANRLGHIIDLIQLHREGKRSVSIVHPYDNIPKLRETLRDNQVRWVASTGPAPLDPLILKEITGVEPGHSFVRPIVSTDPLTFSPQILAAMTIPRTVSINTARHGLDAKDRGLLRLSPKDPSPANRVAAGSSGPHQPSARSSIWTMSRRANFARFKMSLLR